MTKELYKEKSILLKQISQHAPNIGENKTPIKELSLYRYENKLKAANHIQKPGVCVIAQGEKRVFLRDEIFQNNVDNYLLTLMDIPVITEVNKASKDEPYLAISYKYNLDTVSKILVDGNLPHIDTKSSGRTLKAASMDLKLIRSFNKLLSLLDEPETINFLYPLVEKEILFRLLLTDQGHILREIASKGSTRNSIVETIEWLQKNYTKSFKIEDLANNSNMSTSSFHHHFRELTSMTPIQYQKWLRLQEARRLMLSERFDAANAAYKVGYESPSQFSREYSRLFNASPLQDIKQLKASLI